MRKIFISLLMVVLGGTMTMQAQQFSDEQRQEFFNKAAERTAKQIKVSDENKEWFLQTYSTYMQALMEVQTMYATSREKLTTDEERMADIEKSIMRGEAEAKIKRTFMAIFKEKLDVEQLHGIFVPKRSRSNRGGFQGQPPSGFGGGMPGGPGFRQPGGGF